MKRFFPLLLGITLMLCSFSILNATENTPNEDYPTEPFTVEVNFINVAPEDDIANAVSLIKVCRFQHSLSTGQSCSPSSAEMIVDPVTCIGTAKAYVTVTNLSSSPVLNQPYQLPAGVPEMYFEYTAQGLTTTSPALDDFIYYADIRVNNGSLYHLYEKEVVMEFDVETLCPGQAISVNFDARLKEDNGQNFDINPHVGSNGIWYCSVFGESCNFCPPIGGCALNPIAGEELVWENRQACAEYCTVCGGSGGGGGIGGGGGKVANITNDPHSLNDNTFTIESGLPLNMETTPNPFTDEVTLNFTNKIGSISSLQIVDMTGRTYFNDSNIRINASSYSLNTNDLPSGVYFCKVVVNGKVMSKKIIKM